MICNKCGNEVGSASFCPYCGSRIEPGYQNSYAPPQYTDYKQQPPKPDMTVGDWVITLVLTCIPIVNLICLIIWAVSSSPEKVSRKNWAIAQFILLLVFIVIFAILFAMGAIGSMFASKS